MKPVLVVQHVDWESPHRLAEALGRKHVLRVARPLEGEQLPDPRSLAGAVLMGGPMGVSDTARFPELGAELKWIETALTAQLPLLGICLGSQLLARTLGAPVVRAPERELGWHPIEIHAPDDPLLGPLAPTSTVLHWHGEEFAVPAGARPLASSERTACQAFRFATAWGMLFHPEADRALLEKWLREPTMAEEALDAIGPDARARLLDDAEEHERALETRSTVSFEAFAAIVAERAKDSRLPASR